MEKMPGIPSDLSRLYTAGKETQDTKALVENCQREMEDIQDQIRFFHQRLEELERQWKALQQQLRFHQAAIAPVRRLLPEILMKIFDYCLDTDMPSFRRNHAPLVLTHVCYSWRQLALNCPSLWTNIQFGKCPTPEALSMWIRNSNGAPLHLHFSTLASYWTSTIMAVRDVLAQEMTRCASLTLNCSYVVVKQVLPLKISNAPLLRHLSIRCRETGYYRNTELDQDWVVNCPRLESLDLIDAGFILKGLRVPSRLRQLRVKYDPAELPAGPIERVPFSNLDAIIRGCANLELLDFDLAYIEPVPEYTTSTIPPCNCPQLTRLKLTLDRNCSHAALFFPEKIYAPQLRYLGFDGQRWSKGDGVYEMLLRLITNCKDALERLTLENLDMLHTEALALLQEAVNVKRLKISSPTFMDALSWTQPASSTSWPCPKLTYLIVTPDFGASPQLITLLEKRSPPPSHRLMSPFAKSFYLTEVHIQIESPIAWKRGPALERLIELQRRRDGLRLTGLERLIDEMDLDV